VVESSVDRGMNGKIVKQTTASPAPDLPSNNPYVIELSSLSLDRSPWLVPPAGFVDTSSAGGIVAPVGFGSGCAAGGT